MSAACTAESVDPVAVDPAIYVGAVTAQDDSTAALPNVVVGLAIHDGAVDLFFCGGPDEVNTRTAWISGVMHPEEGDSAGETALTLDGAKWEVAGLVSDERVTGTAEFVDENDELRTMSWEVERVTDEFSAAGLYVAPAAGCRTGVVVQDPVDGEPWAQGAYCDQRGFFDQVTPVMPIQLTPELALTVLVGNPLREVVVERLVPTLDTVDNSAADSGAN